MSEESVDNNDPACLAEKRWIGAINRWFDGDAAPLAAAIRDPSLPLTDDAREFLAALAENKINRGKGGRPEDRFPWQERAIMAATFAHWEQLAAIPRKQRAGSPKDRACAAIAAQFGTSADAIRGLLDKHRREGWTIENWRMWGRPDFKDR